MSLRITGLVRIANMLRRELAHPLTPQRRAYWQQTVAKTLSHLDQLLHEHRSTGAALPAPSRRAYEFLRSIDWNALPAATETATPPPGRLNWSGLTRFLDHTLDHLADAATDAQLDAVHQSILRTSRQIESTITLHASRAMDIAPAARIIRGWLAYFAERENLSACAAALRLATPLLAPVLTKLRYPTPLRIHFRPTKLLYRIRSSRFGATLELPTPMIVIDAAGFALLANLIATRNRHARQELLALMAGQAYQDLQAELESLAGVDEQTRGAFHDLAATFDRINARYFAGQLPRPRLAWGRGFSGRKFGHYDPIRDTVMVSSLLDRPDVPQFVVDYLVFHELLHKKLGSRIIDGRRYSHTPEFYQEERAFEQTDDADAILNALARGQFLQS